MKRQRTKPPKGTTRQKNTHKKTNPADLKPADRDNYVFEDKQWQIVNSLRNNIDAVEYICVVLGLVFLKYVSDTFMEQHEKTMSSKWGDSNDREYASDNVFWIPETARWPSIMSKVHQPSIGQIIDDAMVHIERENPTLKDVLPKIYARLQIDRSVLGQLVDIISNIPVNDQGLRSQDILRRIYEYFLVRFASSEGKKGGEFYTPSSVVRLLVEMLEPCDGRIYDPCCGSSGTLVQSKDFICKHATGNGNGGKSRTTIRIFGQESNHTMWRLAKMHLAIHGTEGKIEHGDSFRKDLHPDLEADFILASPPFNAKSWGGEQLQEDKRWKYGMPPTDNANFAWAQHIIHHLSPKGMAGFVLANGSMLSTSSGEGDMRKNIVEADLVDCMVALPGQLFYSTPIPACLWFISRRRQSRQYKRRGNVLFIDARIMGRMEDRTHRTLDEADIRKISDTYHAWQNKKGYKDMPGFCKSVTLEAIRKHDYILVPGRYVDTMPEDDGEPFEQKMKRLVGQWNKQQSEAEKLDKAINENIKMLGFETGGSL